MGCVITILGIDGYVKIVSVIQVTIILAPTILQWCEYEKCRKSWMREAKLIFSRVLFTTFNKGHLYAD